ncbi:unnamed protein product, partial [marine sediment metagenome]
RIRPSVTQQLAKWVQNHDIFVSINLSAQEFNDPELVAIIDGALKNAGGLAPRHLKLELTETESMGDPEGTIEKMIELSKQGIEIFIDDFGTGHSSLSYLRRLPAKVLKIDKDFIDDVIDKPKEIMFLKNIIDIAKSRERTPLVEGVSDRQQHELLTEIGCAIMQGYYFSRPIPAERFEELLQKGAVLPV